MAGANSHNIKQLKIMRAKTHKCVGHCNVTKDAMKITNRKKANELGNEFQNSLFVFHGAQYEAATTFTRHVAVTKIKTKVADRKIGNRPDSESARIEIQQIN